MPQQAKKQPTKKGANKIKRAGCRKGLIARYYAVVYPARKLKRILHNNGSAAAQSWAAKHQCLNLLEG
jgi:hypothetical protein